MKVLHVISSLETGGAQKLLSELLPELSMKGVKVELLVYKRVYNELEKRIEDNGIRIHSLDCANFKSPKIISGLRRYMKGFDIAHIHLFPSLYQAAVASMGLPVKLVYTEHSTSNRRREKKYLRGLERMVYGRYDGVIAISPQTARNLADWIGEVTDIEVIDNGVSLEAIRNAPAKSLDLYGKVVMMVSRFTESKDQKTLIRALPLLPNDDVTLVFVGDGETRKECEALAEELDMADRVVFLGTRSDVASIIKDAYIGVQSSKWEGFGLTAVEFMAAGIPVVASDVDGLRQVVEGAGLLFKAGDEKELALRLAELLEDEEKYDMVREKCRMRAARYDISTTALNYKEFYNRISGDTKELK